jgi:hypothetical protein
MYAKTSKKLVHCHVPLTWMEQADPPGVDSVPAGYFSLLQLSNINNNLYNINKILYNTNHKLLI